MFNLFSDMSRDVWDMLIHHHWCLGRDLGPSVINFFSKKNILSRTSGNDLISILALSDHRKDPSGAHLGPFSSFTFSFLFNLEGIIGRPFKHNRLSWRHNVYIYIYIKYRLILSRRINVSPHARAAAKH